MYLNNLFQKTAYKPYNLHNNNNEEEETVDLSDVMNDYDYDDEFESLSSILGENEESLFD